jgi:hypothetical protein
MAANAVLDGDTFGGAKQGTYPCSAAATSSRAVGRDLNPVLRRRVACRRNDPVVDQVENGPKSFLSTYSR